ncbi:Rha family transcriptional regulator [Comamonas sp.]|uniref:Rha family transcriptional regulator n=1 Tax=Comamonas sp. TaxID=34028 RepID=UPI0028A269D4|nr:Rha family transcriptional regulator [Comamonas sp.]
MSQVTTGTSAAIAAPSLQIFEGHVTTTSNQIAENFGKQHKDVLRAIRNLRSAVEADFYERNFAPIQNITDLGIGRTRQDPAYRITRDGFVFLAMGFTGKEAAAWKVAYLTAFNRMEAELQNQPSQDAQRLQLAQTLATQAGAQVMQTVFDAVMSGSNADWRRARYLLSFGYDQSGQPSLPQTKTVTDGQIVASLPELTRHIATADIMPSDTQLAALASACTQRLTERAQIRERCAATAVAMVPATAPAAHPATAVQSTTTAAPIPPHIGTDGKPLPPGTFRAVFV